MYELLLKWGLDHIVDLVRTKDSRDLAIILEAIKTKNQLVLERFRAASGACQGVIDIALSIEDDLGEFSKNLPRQLSRKLSGPVLLAKLGSDFHPKHYRRFAKARSRFESTNDLLSAYTRALAVILNIENIKKLIKHKDYKDMSNVERTYRGVWTLYAELTSSLLRITSADLRFWLMDSPYVIVADRLAKEELVKLQEFLFSDSWGGRPYHLDLETSIGLERFWSEVTSSTRTRRSAD